MGKKVLVNLVRERRKLLTRFIVRILVTPAAVKVFGSSNMHRLKNLTVSVKRFRWDLPRIKPVLICFALFISSIHSTMNVLKFILCLNSKGFGVTRGPGQAGSLVCLPI